MTRRRRTLGQMTGQHRDGEALPEWLAVALVAGTSAAVLVLEILAGRLLAPYVGVSLETYTAIIGTVLAGIALGAGVGGRVADHVDPRRMIPILLGLGGALAIASIPIVRLLGGQGGPGSQGAPSVLLAAFGFIPAAAVTSAVPPAVVKLQLRNLGETGTTVGRLSAWGTGGAIVGTFVAGYVLVAFAAVTTLIVATGLALVGAGVLMWLTDRRATTIAASNVASVGGVLVVAIAGVVAIDTPCDVQTGYYCASIETDTDDPSGRVLILDDLRHSYVDLDDPSHLEFWYIRRLTDAIDTYAPSGPIEVVSLGAGGLTIPRWIRETRPGSRQTVLEIDPDLIELVERELAFDRADDVDIITGDGRIGLRGLPTDSADVVIGDAFGSRSVPWHLATEEFVAEVGRVLRPGGIYVANIIDGPDQHFLRAESATIRKVLPHVAVMRSEGMLEGFVANAAIVASDGPIDATPWDARRIAVGDDGDAVIDIDDYLDGSPVLTDDFAPVDQLIAGAR